MLPIYCQGKYIGQYVAFLNDHIGHFFFQNIDSFSELFISNLVHFMSNKL